MELQEKHALDELCSRASARNITLYSRFLDLDGQKYAAAAANRQNACFRLFGGAEDAERKMLGANGDEVPRKEDFPIKCIRIEASGEKFNGAPSHRDILGAVMGLGIVRATLGDISVQEKDAYLFCTEQIAPFICENLISCGRTTVRCSLSEPPAAPLRKTKEEKIQVSSPRLDTVIAHLYRLSRTDALPLIHQGRVSLDDSVCMQPDRKIKDGEVLSVRGHGRARYAGTAGETKKGKTILVFQVYI